MRIKIFQKVIDKIRGKFKKNIILSDKHNDIQIDNEIKNNVNLVINGKNNKVIIKTNLINGKLNLKIYGDNNYVFIDEGVSVSSSLFILIGKNHPNFGKVTNSKIEIHKNTTIESMEYYTYNSNTFCNIGEECMFSFGIILYNTDGHPIFDKETKELLNKPKGITIGRHCWLGLNSIVLKNSVLPDNSVVGCNSVYTLNEQKANPNCVFAGNPAKIVKENINWDANGNKYGYIENVW